MEPGCWYPRLVPLGYPASGKGGARLVAGLGIGGHGSEPRLLLRRKPVAAGPRQSGLGAVAGLGAQLRPRSWVLLEGLGLWLWGGTRLL
jgi:hypothetical protein